MDAFSLFVGAAFGAIIMWSVWNFSSKQNLASSKFGSAKKAEKDRAEKDKQAKDDRKAASWAVMESFVWGVFTFGFLVVFAIILFNLSI